MNVGSLSVETEILQSRLAVQLLKERNVVASRRSKRHSAAQGKDVNLSTLRHSDEVKFFQALQSWSENLGLLASDVQSLSTYAARKSEHFEGYDVSMRCLQQIVAHGHAMVGLMSTTSPLDASSASSSNSPLSILKEACTTLILSEEVHETTHLLLQRTLAYASLFSLSKYQFVACAELSRALLVLSYGDHSTSSSSDVSNVWIMRSLAWAGIGNTPLSLLHYKNAVSNGVNVNSESSPATSSTPVPASQVTITKYLEQCELQHANRHMQSSNHALALQELGRILRCFGAGDDGMLNLLTESPDLVDVNVKDYESILSSSSTPGSSPSIANTTKSDSFSLSEDVMNIITSFVSILDSNKGSMSKSIHTLYGKVKGNTLLSKIKARSQIQGSTSGKTNNEYRLLGQVLYHVLVTAFYEAQALYHEQMFRSAQVRYVLSQACVNILKKDAGYVRAIAGVVSSLPCNSDNISLDKAVDEIKSYIESMDTACKCNLWMCSEKLGNSDDAVKIDIVKELGCLGQFRYLAHCVKASKKNEAQDALKEIESSLSPSMLHSESFVAFYLPIPHPVYISPLFTQLYSTGTNIPCIRISPEKAAQDASQSKDSDQSASVIGFMQLLSMVGDKYALCKYLSSSHDNPADSSSTTELLKFLPSTSHHIPYSDFLRYILSIKDICKM